MDKQNSIPEQKSRFTLIEMLIVIAIIGVLAALLMPSLQGAIMTSRQVSCLSNQRQLHVWTMNYADNWNGILPHAGARPTDTSHRYVQNTDSTDWYRRCEYFRSNGEITIMHCPQMLIDIYNKKYWPGSSWGCTYAMSYYIGSNSRAFNNGGANAPLPRITMFKPGQWLFTESTMEDYRPLAIGTTNLGVGETTALGGDFGPYFWRPGSSMMGEYSELGHQNNSANVMRLNGAGKSTTRFDIAGECAAIRARTSWYWALAVEIDGLRK